MVQQTDTQQGYNQHGHQVCMKNLYGIEETLTKEIITIYTLKGFWFCLYNVMVK